MNRFAADWLALREPFDARTRAGALEQRLSDWRGSMDELSVIDLGCGTGANFRRLAPRMGGNQRWLLLDNDPAMLTAIPHHLARWAARSGHEYRLQNDGSLQVRGRGFVSRLQIRPCNLAHERSLAVPSGYRLVTCSALLDLVSESWIQTLTRCCRRQHAAVLWALSYDGRIRFQPPLAADNRVRRLVNRHQHRDKGFGPALGPDAAAAAQKALQNTGYSTWMGRSDWRMSARARLLQSTLFSGWAAVGAELEPANTQALSRWLSQRREALAAGRSHLRVGHLDVLGIPPDGE